MKSESSNQENSGTYRLIIDFNERGMDALNFIRQHYLHMRTGKIVSKALVHYARRYKAYADVEPSPSASPSPSPTPSEEEDWESERDSYSPSPSPSPPPETWWDAVIGWLNDWVEKIKMWWLLRTYWGLSSRDLRGMGFWKMKKRDIVEKKREWRKNTP
jgi:hypothetical protein